jgi:hypothetical protein
MVFLFFSFHGGVSLFVGSAVLFELNAVFNYIVPYASLL